MIHEITGQPGHGKTLYGLFLARKFVQEGRAVYVHGIRDVKCGETGFIPLDDPKAWEALPDNSVVVIDECYTVFPNRNAASAVPPYIEALARHRHRGFDFILIHQQPNQVDPFVRGLVDRHTHVRRKFGFNAAVLKEWDFSCPNPIKDTPLHKPVWRYPKDLYSLYTSATMHTVKKRIPWQLYAVVPILGFVLYVFADLRDGQVVEGVAPTQARAPADEAGVRASVGGASADRSDYEAWMTPRVAGIPWTAPAFDHLQPQAQPEVYCMASGSGLKGDGEMRPGGCTCVTEQGTRAEVPRDVCERIAVDGVYNPFRRVVQDRLRVEAEPQPLAEDVESVKVESEGDAA